MICHQYKGLLHPNSGLEQNLFNGIGAGVSIDPDGELYWYI